MKILCPKCFTSLKVWVTMTVECPLDQPNLNKTAIRKKEVQIIAVDWPAARYYCANCNYPETE